MIAGAVLRDPAASADEVRGYQNGYLAKTIEGDRDNDFRCAMWCFVGLAIGMSLGAGFMHWLGVA